MLGNKNQRSPGYNQSAIHSYLQPFQQQSTTSQGNLSQQLQQRDNNRGSLQKALSPTRSSTNKQASSFKQNSKNQSHNSFKEDNSIGSKVGTSSSLLKNGNNILGGGGLLDGNKQKTENSLSPCVKSNNLTKNALLSPQLVKQSTQNLTFLLNKGKESKSVESQNNYLKDIQEKQNQRALNGGRFDIYQTPQSQSKTNTSAMTNASAVNGQQSLQQYQQSSGQPSGYNPPSFINSNYMNQNSSNILTPSSQSNNICTINLCDKQDIFKNLSLTSNTNNSNINNNGSKSNLNPNNLQITSQSRSPTNNQQSSSNRLVIQPLSQHSTLNSEGGFIKQNQLLTTASQSSQSNAKNYFGYIRSGSQQQSGQQKPPIGNQSSSTDTKSIQHKTKYIDLQPTLTAQKKQNSQQQSSQQQTQVQHSYLNQSIKTDQSNPFNNLSNNSILVSKSSQNGFGSIVSNPQQNLISSSQESDRDVNNKKQSPFMNSNSITSSKSSTNQQKGGISQQLIESRNLESSGGAGNELQKRLHQTGQNIEQLSPTMINLKSDYQHKSESATSPFRDSRQQISILHECDINSNYSCFTCKTKKAKYFILNSDLQDQYFCSKCGIEYAQKLYPSSSNPITANSISTGIGGSAAESYLSPSKVNVINPQQLQTVELRLDQANYSPSLNQQNELCKKLQNEEQLQFQNFTNSKTTNYINQVIPIDKKPAGYDFQTPSTFTQSSPYNYNKIEGQQYVESSSSYLNDLNKIQTNHTIHQQAQMYQTPISTNPQNIPASAFNPNYQSNSKTDYTHNTQTTKIQQEVIKNNVEQQLNNKMNPFVDINAGNSTQPISLALQDFKYQLSQTFNSNNLNQSPNNNQISTFNQNAQTNQTPQNNNNNIQTNFNNNNQLFSQQQQLQQTELQQQKINSNDKVLTTQQQIPQQQINLNIVQQGEDEKIKRKKLNNFQNRLFRVKEEFESMQKIFLERNDTSIQEYHKNIENIDRIQKVMISAMDEITSRAKEQMLNNFNDSLSKYKTSKFEIQQILNYLHCTENDLMSNLDSIIKDMDVESLDDIIGQYDQIITQYEEARTKKFLSQTFVVQQLKYVNDANQLTTVCQKIQDALNHLLTMVTYTQNVQRNQINTNHTLYGTTDPNGKTQPFILQQNSFLNQQPKSIYISFENRDIFQSAVHSTSEQHHPETQPQSPSFQSTLSLQAYQNNQQVSSSNNGQQFLTFKDIINCEEHNSKGQQQMQQSSTSSQNGYSSNPTQSNLIISKHFYPSNGDIIQRTSFGGSDQANKQEYPDSPPSIQPSNTSNYYQGLANSSKQVLLTHEDDDTQHKGGIQYSSQKVGSEGFQGILQQQPYQSLQLNTPSVTINQEYQLKDTTYSKNNPINSTSQYQSGQSISHQATQLQSFSPIPDYKTSEQYQSSDLNKSKRRIVSDADQGSGDKSNRNQINTVGNVGANSSGNQGDKIKSEDFKGYYQKTNEDDELEVNALSSPTNNLLFRSQDNLFGKIGSMHKNYNGISNVSTASQNYHGGQSENHSEDFLFNQSTTTAASNNNFSIKNKQKYNELLQKIQVNQSQTEKLCTDVLSSGQNFKFSQMEDNFPSTQNPIRQSAQSNILKK